MKTKNQQPKQPKRQQPTPPVDTSHWLAEIPVYNPLSAVKPRGLNIEKRKLRDTLDGWYEKIYEGFYKRTDARAKNNGSYYLKSGNSFYPGRRDESFYAGIRDAHAIMKNFILNVRFGGYREKEIGVIPYNMSRAPFEIQDPYPANEYSPETLRKRWADSGVSASRRHSTKKESYMYDGQKVSSPRDILDVMAEPDRNKRRNKDILTPHDYLKLHLENVNTYHLRNVRDEEDYDNVKLYYETLERTLKPLVDAFSRDIARLVPGYDKASDERRNLYLNSLNQTPEQIATSVKEAESGTSTAEPPTVARQSKSMQRNAMQTKLKRRLNLKSSPVDAPSVDVFANIFRGAPQ